MTVDVNTVLTIPSPGVAVLVDRPLPQIIPGYAVVEVAIAPVCIEARIWTKHQFEYVDDPMHLGHEGVGTIVEVAEGSRFEIGDRVIVFQGDHCGVCYACRNGLSPTYCAWNGPPDGEALHGIEHHNGSESGGFGMVRYRIGAEPNLVRIPDELSFRHAAAANCSLGCTFTGQEVVGIRAGDNVLIGGVGFLGLSHVINALYRGANPIVLIRNEYRKELCRQIGAEHFIDPGDDDWLDQLYELTGGLGADAAFECSGSSYYQRRLFDGLRIYGRFHFTGHMPDETLELHPLEDVVDKQLMLTGGHDVRAIDREGLIRMLRKPEVQRQVDVMVTHEFPMSAAAQALDVSASKACGKIYLRPQE